MLVTSLDPASSGTWVAALTTAVPTMCHIAGTVSAPALTSYSLSNSGCQGAVAAVRHPRRQRRLAGQRDDADPWRDGGAAVPSGR